MIFKSIDLQNLIEQLCLISNLVNTLPRYFKWQRNIPSKTCRNDMCSTFMLQWSNSLGFACHIFKTAFNQELEVLSMKYYHWGHGTGRCLSRQTELSVNAGANLHCCIQSSWIKNSFSRLTIIWIHYIYWRDMQDNLKDIDMIQIILFYKKPWTY